MTAVLVVHALTAVSLLALLVVGSRRPTHNHTEGADRFEPCLACEVDR